MTSSRKWAIRSLPVALATGMLALYTAGCAPAATTPTPAPGAATPSPTPTPATQSIPKVPYLHTNWVGTHTSDCLVCHSQIQTVHTLFDGVATGSAWDFMPAPTAMAAYTANQCLSCHTMETAPTTMPSYDLVSAKTTTTPSIADGFGGEALWAAATASVIPLHGVWAGPASDPFADDRTVTIKSVYDTNNIYILATVNDPTQNLLKTPWVLGTDGNFSKPTRLIGDPLGNDDKLVFAWQTFTADATATVPNFNTTGCAVVCHDQGLTGTGNANMYTADTSQVLDMWRTNVSGVVPLKVLNDGYISANSFGYIPGGITSMNSQNATAALTVSDGTTSGTKSVTVPLYGFADGMDIQHESGNPAWMSPGATATITPTMYASYTVGSQIPTYINNRTAAGAAAQTQANARYANGAWTYIIKRSLTTPSNTATSDIQFTDLTRTYPFAMGAMDHTNYSHGYQYGTTKLTFQQ